MIKQITRIIIWLALLTYCLGFGAPLALAATATPAQSTAKNGQALEIAPPVVYLTVDPGKTYKTQIFIRDISSGNLQVAGQVNNFIASGEDGTPKILLDNDAASDPYTIVNWVAPLPKLLLIPREIKSMTATINVPADASPGGHYGVIRFTATAPSVEGGSGVSLSASIGVLMLITVTGNIQEGLSVKEFSVNNGGSAGTFFQSGPVNFVERLENTGNVHLKPVGQVSITDMFGKKFAAVNVNLPPANILPHSTRKFTQPLDKAVIGNKRLFGRYTATLKVDYGDSKKTLTSTTVFWVVPYKLIGGIILTLIVGFFLIRFLISRYNQRILSRSQKSRRRK